MKSSPLVFISVALSPFILPAPESGVHVNAQALLLLRTLCLNMCGCLETLGDTLADFFAHYAAEGEDLEDM